MEHLRLKESAEMYHAVPVYKEYADVPFNLSEALRYAGMPAHNAPEIGKESVDRFAAVHFQISDSLIKKRPSPFLP